MTYTEEMTTSEILLRLASMRNELLQAVNDIEKISKNICYKAEQTENSSEKPNNCEHITEDGVTCAKYPACDDCLDNPLNKVKGSERLLKGSEQTKPTISKMEQVETMSCQECKHFHENAVMYLDQCDFCFKDCKYEPKDEPTISKMEQVDEPQKDCKKCKNYDRCKNNRWKCCVYQPKDEPQTDCPWK